MVLDHGISTSVLIPSIGLLVLIYYGFGTWYWKKSNLYKEKDKLMGQNSKAWILVSLCDFDLLYLVHDLIYKYDNLGITDVWIIEKGKLSFIDLYVG